MSDPGKSEFIGLICDLAQLYDDEMIARWLAMKHPRLGETPLERIKAGDIRHVRQIVSQVLDSAYT